MALEGRKGLPLPTWASVLVMAETWGVPPWEIVERRGALKWSRRFGYLSQAREKAHEKINKKNQPKNTRSRRR